MSEGYATKVRPEKAAAVEKIKTELEQSQAAVVTEYRGLTVQQLKTLRTRLLETESTYRVSKNTLVRLAVNALGLGELEELLVGPTAVAYVKGDPIAAAKILATFAKEFPALLIKGGVLDGKVLSENETKNLATVDALDVSRAKIAGMLVAPLQQLMMLLEAPTARILYVLDEIARRGGIEAAPEGDVAPESEPAPESAAAEPEASGDAAPEGSVEASSEAEAEAAADGAEQTQETQDTEEGAE
jgi:large subunit ribosomal protein L10